MIEKIRKLNEFYKLTLPDEYRAVLKHVVEKRKLLKNELAAVNGEHVLERHLMEWPESLYTMIYKELDEVEFAEFVTTKGQRSCAKVFPEYRIPTKI